MNYFVKKDTDQSVEMQTNAENQIIIVTFQILNRNWTENQDYPARNE